MPLTHPVIVPAIRLDHDASAETQKALERATKPWVAGFIVFGGDATEVAKLTAVLGEVAGRRLFFSADLERGAGQQFTGHTRLPDFGILGLAGTLEDAEDHGRLTAREARAAGIDVLFGPSVDVRSELDNPILGNRAFGFDPQRVADLGCRWSFGALLGGALSVPKHFPGHGATREDSHEALPVVDADLHTLEARDLMPFARLLGLPYGHAVMAAHIAFPALDPSGTIATFSRPILDRARALAHRDDILVFTDAMMMAGATVPGGEPEAARRAQAAGCDMLLYPEDPESVAAALEDDEHTERARAHRMTFLDHARRAAERGEASTPARDAHAAMEALAARSVAMAGVLPLPGGGVTSQGTTAFPRTLILVDDDGIEDRGAVLAAEAAKRGVEVVRLRADEDAGYTPPPAAEGASPDHATQVVVFAQARAWKGASGVSERGCALVADVVRAVRAAGGIVDVAWCAPRPGAAYGAHIPGNGPQIERALAAALFEGGSGPV